MLWLLINDLNQMIVLLNCEWSENMDKYYTPQFYADVITVKSLI